MVLCLLVALSISRDVLFEPDVLHLTGLPPNDGTPYFVMVHHSGCPHCVELAPTWNSAAKLGAGLATWAELNCTENESACLEIRIQEVPELFYFLKGSIYPYRGMKLSRLLVNWASNFVDSTAAIITSENFTTQLSGFSALMLTDKYPPPKIWKAIENVLNRTDVTFYVSGDRSLQEKFELTAFPAVYAINGKEIHEFKLKLTVADAVKFFTEEFAPLDL
jgi:thiol-disulfide isomerase/thioredoxin